MRAVNLLPRDGDRQRDGGGAGRMPLIVAAGGVAAITIGAVVLFVSASGSVSDTRAQLDSAQAAIARVPSGGQPVLAPAAITQERADRVTALGAALATRVPLDRLLRELAYVLPEDAWLTGLTVTAPATDGPTGASPGAPAPASTSTQGVTIEGATYSNRSVARVLARLAAMPSVDQVRLTASARRDPATENTGAASSKTTAKAEKKKKKSPPTVVTFTITANLRTGSGS
jgi:Tfp pilus assembly protein PilN